MNPNQIEQDTVRISVPITIIGPLEEFDRGTILYLSSGFGQVRVSEKLDEITAQITNIARSLAGQGR